MHLFIAEHDLFISHDAEDTGKELTRTLDYLIQADIRNLRDKVAGENIRNRYESTMTTLRKMINEL